MKKFRELLAFGLAAVMVAMAFASIPFTALAADTSDATWKAEVIGTSNQIEMRVLKIEINPYINALSRRIYSDTEIGDAVGEMKADWEDSSHNTVNVNIYKTEWLNEFSTIKSQIDLVGGGKDYRYDEVTYMEIIKNGWNGIWSSPWTQQLPGFSFDYDYLIDKFDLVNRKNNGEFDQG